MAHELIANFVKLLCGMVCDVGELFVIVVIHKKVLPYRYRGTLPQTIKK